MTSAVREPCLKCGYIGCDHCGMAGGELVVDREAVSIAAVRREVLESQRRAYLARVAAAHRRRRRRVDLAIVAVFVVAFVVVAFTTSAHAAAPRRVCLLTGRCYTTHPHHHRHRGHDGVPARCPTWRDHPTSLPAGCPPIYPPPYWPPEAPTERSHAMNTPGIDWEQVARAALPDRIIERAVESNGGKLTAPAWKVLATIVLHELQVAAIEDLAGERLSVLDLSRRHRVPLANMAYHVARLREWGLLRKDGADQVRGAKQQFYRLKAVRPSKAERAKAAA